MEVNTQVCIVQDSAADAVVEKDKCLPLVSAPQKSRMSTDIFRFLYYSTMLPRIYANNFKLSHVELKQLGGKIDQNYVHFHSPGY